MVLKHILCRVSELANVLGDIQPAVIKLVEVLFGSEIPLRQLKKSMRRTNLDSCIFTK